MIPNKSNFKFQELTPITGVKPYVLRFWETEFPEISPVNSESGQKIYSRQDVETILKIKSLLFDEKKSIPEVKLALRGHSLAEDVIKEEKVSMAPPVFATESAVTISTVSDQTKILHSLMELRSFVDQIKLKYQW